MWLTLVCLYIAGAQAQSDSLLVEIDQGLLRGFRSADGDIFNFLSVPYATAPNGTNKFKAPLPAPVWAPETFNATTQFLACPQPFPVPNQKEDCLVANIFVPDTNNTDLPVLVNIHGGGYMSGVGNNEQYTNLVQTEKVIVVTFNYRLGITGFLCLGTRDVPGNAGMKDQVALLRWVNRNIASFGGNPNDVTITGCSAGGGSVDFLTLSPLTSGLFKKVITNSGGSIGFVGAQMQPIENAKAYARKLNFANIDDFDALEEFYKTSSTELLASLIFDSWNNTVIMFTPCVERDTGTGEEIFLSETPWNILTRGQHQKFPTLYGYANMEASLVLSFFDAIKEDMTANFSSYLPQDLGFKNEEEKLDVAKTVQKFYFGDAGVTDETILGYLDYFTDIMFAYPMLKELKIRRNSTNDTVYLYEYSFVDEKTPLVPGTSFRGADHCAQSLAVMDEDKSEFTEDYVNMKAVMREIWLNFIISGNPTPENSSLPQWAPVDLIWSPHMALHNSSNANMTLIMEERAQFWEAIYEKHYRQPVAPSVPGSATNVEYSILLLSGILIINSIVP